MNEQYVTTVLTILVLSISFVNSIIVMEPTSTDFCVTISNAMNSRDFTISTTSDPIVIESDADFEIQGWLGNGTASDPYLLSDEVIEGNPCIRITGTSSHFRIENCTLNGVQYGILLQNTQNSFLTSNHISAPIGIKVEQSSNCFVAENNLLIGGIILQSTSNSSIHNNTMTTSFYLSYCMNITVSNHTIYGAEIGCAIDHSYNICVVNNTLGSDYAMLISLSDSVNCSIYRNNFAGYYECMTYDSGGSANSWDDGVSCGNGWSNYNGTGNYSIPGNTGSIDRFPSQFISPVPLDFRGPVIEAYLHNAIYDVCSIPYTISFVANVSDPSGIDTVRVFGMKMNHSPTPSNPNRYVLSFSFNGGAFYYSYWAIDTLGYSSESGQGFISVSLMNCPSDTTHEIHPFVSFLFGGGGIVLVIVIPIPIIYWINRREQK